MPPPIVKGPETQSRSRGEWEGRGGSSYSTSREVSWHKDQLIVPRQPIILAKSEDVFHCHC